MAHTSLLSHPPNGTLGLAALDNDTVDWLKRTGHLLWRLSVTTLWTGSKELSENLMARSAQTKKKNIKARSSSCVI